MQWTGVMPAITTPFAEDGSIDHGFHRGARPKWLVEHGQLRDRAT